MLIKLWACPIGNKTFEGNVYSKMMNQSFYCKKVIMRQPSFFLLRQGIRLYSETQLTEKMADFRLKVTICLALDTKFF